MGDACHSEGVIITAESQYDEHGGRRERRRNRTGRWYRRGTVRGGVCGWSLVAGAVSGEWRVSSAVSSRFTGDFIDRHASPKLARWPLEVYLRRGLVLVLPSIAAFACWSKDEDGSSCVRWRRLKINSAARGLTGCGGGLALPCSVGVAGLQRARAGARASWRRDGWDGSVMVDGRR